MRNKVVVEDPALLFLSSTLFCATTVDNCIEKRSPHTKQRQVDADQQPPKAQCQSGLHSTTLNGHEHGQRHDGPRTEAADPRRAPGVGAPAPGGHQNRGGDHGCRHQDSRAVDPRISLLHSKQGDRPRAPRKGHQPERNGDAEVPAPVQVLGDDSAQQAADRAQGHHCGCQALVAVPPAQ
ncbi:hypothetical protein [Streptomyces sanglieri]|uniref:hypothetical protein n=1 Tax=Streptomyces sanglieri TaxID=193460 RepID=UPI003523C1F1